VSFISGLVSLRTLRLSFNDITLIEVDSFEELTALETLYDSHGAVV